MATDDIDVFEGGGEPVELADLLNRVLDKGVVVHGDVTLAVADIDLVKLNLGLLLSAFETLDVRSRQREGAAERNGSEPSQTGAATLSRAFGPPKLGVGTVRAGGGAPSEPVSAGTAGTPSVAQSSRTDASLAEVARGLPERINTDADRVESGLARLVLTLIEVLRKVLEHQAVRRMDGGTLTPDEVERLGLALSRLHGRMQDLQQVFGLSPEDLTIDLGPLGRYR